ncbi:porin [Litorilituus sediminis]|uniref:Porin n=1 Tax=Litorilituus sediminis TaxID=718192 RepID=A0A4P6P2A0_9GAMM|nr:porin [Litorilituus sediminis]
MFGAEASGTYNFGTDGGFSGSGRAEQALQYKLNLGDLSLGAQYLASEDELHTTGENGEDLSAVLNFNNSYGISALYQTPFDIGLGLAYNKAKIKLSANGASTDEVDDELISAHITYRPYGSLGLHVALVYTDMKNHDVDDVGKFMNKSTGIELFSAYRFDNDISVIVGYNSLKDNSSSNNPVASDGLFHKKYYILSAKYHWDEDFHLYIESKIDDSTLHDDTTSLAEDATGIGMMFTF